MTAISVQVKVLNSLLYIRDASLVDLPAIHGHAAVWSTPSCVAISCLPDCDGPTTVVMAAEPDLEVTGKLLFDGELKTPSHKIIVETVLAKSILGQSVSSGVTRVRIWTNGLRDTDQVLIALS